jgi:hypothetical protein
MKLTFDMKVEGEAGPAFGTWRVVLGILVRMPTMWNQGIWAAGRCPNEFLSGYPQCGTKAIGQQAADQFCCRDIVLQKNGM